MKTANLSNNSPSTPPVESASWKFPESGTHSVVVTPALAEQWIEQNLHNRKVKEDVVRSIARDMLQGNWRETHQGIAFARISGKDELIDGQHRLLAIILSGCTVRMQVTFGLSAEARDAIDRNCPRSVPDQLRLIYGMKDGRVIAMICNQIAELTCQHKVRRATVPQTMAIYALWKDSIDQVLVLRSVSKGLRQAGILAGFAFAWPVKKDAEQLFEDFNALPAASKLHPQSPIAKLRAFCVSVEAGFLTMGYSRGMTEVTLQALWLQERQPKIDKLEIGNGEGWKHFASLQKDRAAECQKLFPALDLKKNEIAEPPPVNELSETPAKSSAAKTAPNADLGFAEQYEAMKVRLGLTSAAPAPSIYD